MRTALAVLLLFSAPAFQSAWGQSRGSDIDQRMRQIEARLDAMEAQMDRIGTTADASERQKLLGAHARAWRQTAAQMRDLNRFLGPQMRAMMGAGKEIPSAEKMMQVHDLMDRRVAIMERMMEQAMEQAMGHVEAGAGRPAR